MVKGWSKDGRNSGTGTVQYQFGTAGMAQYRLACHKLIENHLRLHPAYHFLFFTSHFFLLPINIMIQRIAK